MRRDFFRTAQMAIILLEKPPKLELKQGSVTLHTDLTGQSLGIYNNLGKKFLERQFLPTGRPELRRKLREHARELHQALVSGSDQHLSLLPKGVRQPYRWASGGTLPIVRWHGAWWCALFWRDIQPIGWNIANGASETKEEYKNLDRLIARETREELIILDRNPITAGDDIITAHHLSFEGSLVEPDALDTSLAKRRTMDGWPVHPGDIENDRRKVSFVPGPHKVLISYHKRGEQAIDTAVVSNIVLSINPLEFGIEATRLAVIELDNEDYLVDGEVLEQHPDKWLVRRPVALFRLSALHRIWSEGGVLGEDCDPESKHLEGRRLGALTADDIHVFSADVLARKLRPDVPGAPKWLRNFEKAFDQLLPGGSKPRAAVPDPLQVFCPVTWRVLEIAFARDMIGPDGPKMAPEQRIAPTREEGEGRPDVVVPTAWSEEVRVSHEVVVTSKPGSGKPENWPPAEVIPWIEEMRASTEQDPKPIPVHILVDKEKGNLWIGTVALTWMRAAFFWFAELVCAGGKQFRYQDHHQKTVNATKTYGGRKLKYKHGDSSGFCQTRYKEFCNGLREFEVSKEVSEALLDAIQAKANVGYTLDRKSRAYLFTYYRMISGHEIQKK